MEIMGASVTAANTMFRSSIALTSVAMEDRGILCMLSGWQLSLPQI